MFERVDGAQWHQALNQSGLQFFAEGHASYPRAYLDRANGAKLNHDEPLGNRWIRSGSDEVMRRWVDTTDATS